VVTVEPSSDPVPTITLVDLDVPDGLLERPAGSDGASGVDTGSGDVKVTLEWESGIGVQTADLDLHVTEPSGTKIWFGELGPTSTGGELDVDANAGCGYDLPVENVFWPLNEAPLGDYFVEVHGWRVAGCGSGAYTLTIQVAGEEPEIHTGFVGHDESDYYDFSR
jgi:hypothetical protein